MIPEKGKITPQPSVPFFPFYYVSFLFLHDTKMILSVQVYLIINQYVN